jgi:NADH-quinone oxidoreductase subunit J
MSVETIAFAAFAFIAIAGAVGMTTTMSMFRSGIFLMASFTGVAGLFILLAADLIGLLQIMMYVGGMLVMILFMVLFMHDPGGAMMASMKGLDPAARLFSRGLVPEKAENDSNGEHRHHSGHDHARHDNHSDMAGHGGMTGMAMSGADMGGMNMDDMAMTTPAKPYAFVVATSAAILLVALLVVRPAWHLVAATPDPDSPRRIGLLLMDKYMVGFEGAGMMILLGIVGAVLLARASTWRGDRGREADVAEDKPPTGLADETLWSDDTPPEGRR